VFSCLMLGNHGFVLGLPILAFVLFGWRAAYTWLIRQPYLQGRTYVLGRGERAKWLVDTMRWQPELAMEVVGWAGATGNRSLTRETLRTSLADQLPKRDVDRVIVALEDRRGTMPVRELVNLRLNGIKVEEPTGLMEKILGKIELNVLHPSWLVSQEGFKLNRSSLHLRRFVLFLLSFIFLAVVSPLIPVIAILIKLNSPRPGALPAKAGGQDRKCLRLLQVSHDVRGRRGEPWPNLGGRSGSAHHFCGQLAASDATG